VTSLPSSSSVGSSRSASFRHLHSPWVIGLALLATVAMLGWLFFYSPIFSARTVLVVGSHQVTEDQVLAAAEVPKGMALARLPLSDIAARVEQLDAVATAHVEREWPDTVRIVVTERRPVAAVATTGGFGIVGSDGEMYRVVATRPTDLPMLDRLSPDLGTATSDTSDDVDVATFTVARELPPRFAQKVDTINATSVRAVRVVLRNGSSVQWGSANNTNEKAQLMLRLLQKQAPRATTYNVSVPEAPAWSS